MKTIIEMKNDEYYYLEDYYYMGSDHDLVTFRPFSNNGLANLLPHKGKISDKTPLEIDDSLRKSIKNIITFQTNEEYKTFLNSNDLVEHQRIIGYDSNIGGFMLNLSTAWIARPYTVIQDTKLRMWTTHFQYAPNSQYNADLDDLVKYYIKCRFMCTDGRVTEYRYIPFSLSINLGDIFHLATSQNAMALQAWQFLDCKDMLKFVINYEL